MSRAITFSFWVSFFLLGLAACGQANQAKVVDVATINGANTTPVPLLTGAQQMQHYLHLLVGKNVGVVANQTSVLYGVHLVDTLLHRGVKIKRVFSPEHGFRGNHDAGAIIKHSKDDKTGLPIFSLHGKTKKPTNESLKGIDVMIFDIQDVGVRFYTYISTLHYVMEACAENDILLIVLDRPNPNAHYVDGPVLEAKYSSFVGMHPVPIVYGVSIGEYAQMINGEKWLKDDLQCKLKVVALKGWSHNTEYVLPIPPSPNLPNQKSIYLYPSLCLFEGTIASVGRGTDSPFQLWGHPGIDTNCIDTALSFRFKPVSIPGKSKYPKHENKTCFGVSYASRSVDEIKKDWQFELKPILDAINCSGAEKDAFFDRVEFFNLLAGNATLLKDIKVGLSEEEIKARWASDLKIYMQIREKYLIYK